MKTMSNELQARFQTDALTICLCWKLSRRDGLVIGLTDHDETLVVDGVIFAPGVAVEAGEFTQNSTLKPGRASAGGVLSADAISEDDLVAGLWNGCQIDIYRVDWSAPELGGVAMWSGVLSEITRQSSGAFEAEIVSLKAELERPVGRVLQRRCDAILGDARCGVAAEGRTCDQRYETCRTVFANSDNFRGFPHMPGMDFVLAGPVWVAMMVGSVECGGDHRVCARLDWYALSSSGKHMRCRC